MVPPMTMTRLDLTGLKCPLPALKTRKALQSLKAGERLEVCCTDPLADRVEIVDRSDLGILFLIEKTGQAG